MSDLKQLTLVHAQFSSSIRRVVIDDVEYFSLVDIMAEFADTKNAVRKYWADTKRRLIRDGFDVSDGIRHISLMDKTGKRKQKTDCANGQTVMRIVQSIPSSKAEPIREWLAELGYRAIEEMANPELAVVRRQAELKKLTDAGYGNHPAVQHLRDRDTNIAVFKSLKATIARVCENPRWGHIFNTEYNAMFGQVAAQLELILQTKSIRDALPSLQLTALTYAERTLQAMLEAQDRLDNDTVVSMVDEHIRPIGQHLRQTCDMLGIHHITGKPLLSAQVD
jgi:hypothetical protein